MGEGDDRLIGMSTAENLHTGCAVLGIKAAGILLRLLYGTWEAGYRC